MLQKLVKESRACPSRRDSPRKGRGQLGGLARLAVHDHPGLSRVSRARNGDQHPRRPRGALRGHLTGSDNAAIQYHPSLGVKGNRRVGGARRRGKSERDHHPGGGAILFRAHLLLRLNRSDAKAIAVGAKKTVSERQNAISRERENSKPAMRGKRGPRPDRDDQLPDPVLPA